MKYDRVWINCIDNIGENKNGYFCQVYSNEDMTDEIDYFIVHPWDCDCTDKKEVEKFIEKYARRYQVKTKLLLGFNDVVEEYAEKFLKINLRKDIMRCPDITTHYTEFGKYVDLLTKREDKPPVITTQSLEMIDVLLESDLDFDVVTIRKDDDGEIRVRTLPKEEVIKDREAFCFDPRL